MGLYDDDKITTGEFSDWDYLEPKYTFEMLEAALKSREAESRIVGVVDDLLRQIQSGEKKYPDLLEMKKWKEKAEQISQKVNRNAVDVPWKAPFNATWGTQPHKELWNAYHKARAEIQAENWSEAKSQASHYIHEFTRYSDAKSDHPLSQWYRQMTDDQTSRFAGYVDEMKAVKSQAEKKLA